MRIVKFSVARNNLKAVLDQVVEDADVTVISRPDAPDAVVMSYTHYSSLIESIHLLGSPANAAHLSRSIAQLTAGHASASEESIEGDDPMIGQFLDLLAHDIASHPERLQAVDAGLVRRVDSLVGELQVDFDAVLEADDECAGDKAFR
ncbi:MAG: type II toxin-antitoxin system PrlF family antitoxin [Sideroxyarcus sp.]|nr:type II toxin-antitoxin system PrlF family antitoxin [Sideroxyarcus sp.]